MARRAPEGLTLHVLLTMRTSDQAGPQRRACGRHRTLDLAPGFLNPNVDFNKIRQVVCFHTNTGEHGFKNNHTVPVIQQPGSHLREKSESVRSYKLNV